jgi:hypothetical protein
LRRGLHGLLRLRKAAKVERLIEWLIEWLFRREDCTRATEASLGWQAVEAEQRLCCWINARRGVVLCRRIENDIVRTSKKHARNGNKEPFVLALPRDEVQDIALPGFATEATAVQPRLAAAPGSG